MEPQASDAAEERLGDWVRTALGKEKVELSWGLPLVSAKSPTVGLTLLEILPTPSPRIQGKPPLRLKLRYVLTVQAPDPQVAHRLLIALAFSAMDETDWDVELGSLPAGVWDALGVPLQPSILLNVPLLQERPERQAQLVRVPLVLKSGPVRAITGTVLGPGEIPIMGARVDLPSLGRTARTDHLGRFQLTGIPPEAAASSLRVRAKGVETSVDLKTRAPSGDPSLVIRVNPLED